ncbi:hypothetical protein TREMEDRAFT_64606 [Tremella mesenterica DSM 1558]|nr:uncharacterized protein TREMEDRAFT_64606 [Tremella mesenterica DSM 1558]EIW67355.1 hypothetical protein TREMEDRAFT_64606 [Tremella mesenterica DSM 1558]
MSAKDDDTDGVQYYGNHLVSGYLLSYGPTHADISGSHPFLVENIHLKGLRMSRTGHRDHVLRERERDHGVMGMKDKIIDDRPQYGQQQYGQPQYGQQQYGQPYGQQGGYYPPPPPQSYQQPGPNIISLNFPTETEYQPQPMPQPVYVQQQPPRKSGGGGEGCLACCAGALCCCCAEELCCDALF